MNTQEPGSIKILHLFNDDKFVDSAIHLFESVIPKQSQYIILNKNQSDVLIHVKSVNVLTLDAHSYDDLLKISSFINNSECTKVFFHALDLPKRQILLNVKSRKVFVWFLWGFDFYLPWLPLREKLYEDHTRMFIESDTSLVRKIFNRMLYGTDLYRFKLNSKATYNSEFYQTISKVDYVAPVVPNEYEIIRSVFPKIKFLPFNYTCLELLLSDEDLSENKDGVDILVGNSADPSNNHVDIFKKLAKLDIKGRNVVVPLNYGGTQKYINFVKENGIKILGDHFKPVLDYLPLDQYNKILRNCGIVIFNHIRQQGLGNIITTLMQGSRLFLNTKSPILEYLKSEDVVLFDLNRINNELIKQPLNSEQVAHNRRQMNRLYNKEAVQNKIRALANELDISVASVSSKKS